MPLRTLYLDMNSFFASVEQQLRPELRGRPVAVAAVDVDSTCCIAASREAKQLGIRTGTSVREIRKFRDVVVVEARPEKYVQIHHRILEAAETCLPVDGVHSIDELSCRLFPAEAEPSAAVRLARRIKRAIHDRLGACLTCSIGLAPNRLLAKTAADSQKPDGLVLFHDADLPQALWPLRLQDLPGIGPKMLARLHSVGVTTTARLCELSESQMQMIWSGIVGRRWWHWLRGDDPPVPPERRSSVGHSHVLPPELRTEEGARAVLMRLIHKVAARLRRMDCWAGRLEVYVSFTFQEEGWGGSVALGVCQDTLTMIEAFDKLWSLRPRGDRPTQVAVTLYELTPGRCAAEPLFDAERRRVDLSRTLDRLNGRFGPDTVYFAGMHGMAQTAPTRIAFNRVPDMTCDIVTDKRPHRVGNLALRRLKGRWREIVPENPLLLPCRVQHPRVNPFSL